VDNNILLSSQIILLPIRKVCIKVAFTLLSDPFLATSEISRPGIPYTCAPNNFGANIMINIPIVSLSVAFH
jgi:hypothetical protein